MSQQQAQNSPADDAEIIEKAKKMFAGDDWVIGFALSKAEPEKRVEVLGIFVDLLEKKAAENAEGYECEMCGIFVPPRSHTCPGCGTW